MVEIAKRVERQLTVMVFNGESVSPICLLRELHSHLALSRIAIHTPGEADVGVWNCVYCCPICSYVIKNNITLLNDIILGQFFLQEVSSLCGGHHRADEKAHCRLWTVPGCVW